MQKLPLKISFLTWAAGFTLPALILMCVGSVAPQHSTFAATPYSQGRYCGAPGQRSCPPPAPVITPWGYIADYPPLNGNPTFNSIADLEAGWTANFTQNGICSITYGAPYDTNQDSYDAYGIWVSGIFDLSDSVVFYSTQAPICGNTGNGTLEFQQLRAVYCPFGSTITYTASPLTGPYCLAPSPPQPQIFKQLGPGCPSSCTPGIGNSGAADASSDQTIKGDPISVSNGNKFEIAKDYGGVGGNPIEFVRTYNSLAGYYLETNYPIGAQYMGAAWSATYFQYLQSVSVTDSNATYNTVYAYRPNGRVIAFNMYQGVYSPDADVADRLVVVSGGGWQYQTGDDTIETYNASGQLVSLARRGYAPLTITHANGSGTSDPPVSVMDPFGHALQFTYFADYLNVQRLGSVKDPAGKTIQYGYDDEGNLTSVINADQTTQTYAYEYETHALLAHTDESNIQDASWTYSNFVPINSQRAGGVDSYTFAYSTSGSGGSVNVIDPLGQSRTYNQTLIGGSYRMTDSSGPCAGCGDDQKRVLDGSGNITSRTDWNNYQTTYTYDTVNNLETSRTEAYGTLQARTITTQWNTSWRQPALLTEPNRSTAWTYDSMGNVLTKTITDTTVSPTVARTWTYTYDSYGRMLTADGPRTDVTDRTMYAYYTCTTGGKCGKLQTITDALGHVTTFNTYNSHGQPLTVTDANGVVTTYTYDARLRLTSRKVGTETIALTYYPTGLLKVVTLADGSTITYTYDPAHRLTKITDSAGNYVAYTLDAMGNRTAESSYNASSSLERTHTRVFNALNELYQDINAAGSASVATTYAYDGNGNLMSAAAPLSRTTGTMYDALNRLSQITDAKGGVTKLGYDANDNLALVIDPKNLTTSYTHDGFDGLTKVVSPDTGTTSTTYDSGGNPKTTTDARSAVATYFYDALNRPTQVAYTDQTIAFTYDTGTYGKGRLTGASDANHSIAWAYDDHGRVTKKTQVVGSLTAAASYSYTNGDLTSLVTPSGKTVSYTYANHRISSIAVNGTTLLSNVTYDPFGPVTGWTWGNGTTVTRAYDEDGNPQQIVTAGVMNGYTVDEASRITGISDSGQTSGTFTFGYDRLDRVTSGHSSAKSRGYTYDANGNRLTTTGTTASSEMVATTSNRLSATSGGISRTYSYDAAGNTLGYANNTYTFNQRGRMSSATVSAGTTTYIYNALGEMIKKSGNGGTTLLMYDEAGHVLGEYSSTGTLIEETVWLGDTPVATLQANGTGFNTYYVHTDHLNTPRKITRPSDNAQLWRWDPDTFGSVAPAGSISYNLRFPGQYYMAETGLFYNYFRDYDPQMGRYVESDPIGMRGGVNTYAYANGNPISLRDPTGQDPLIGTTVGLIAGGIAGGLGAIAQHGSNTDILYGILSGAAIGAATGALDPSLGVATLAIIGGTAAGLGDLVGQGVAGGGTACKPIKWGATAGAVVGGAIGGAGGVLYGTWATGLGVSEIYATSAGASLSSVPGIFLPTIGDQVFPTQATGP